MAREKEIVKIKKQIKKGERKRRKKNTLLSMLGKQGGRLMKEDPNT